MIRIDCEVNKNQLNLFSFPLSFLTLNSWSLKLEYFENALETTIFNTFFKKKVGMFGQKLQNFVFQYSLKFWILDS